MTLNNAQIVAIDSVPFYVDAGIEAAINSIVSGKFSLSGEAFLTAVNAALDPALPGLGEDLLLQIIVDLKAKGEFTNFQVFGTEMPYAAQRPEAPGGIAADGSFFSTPTTGVYNIRVYKNGALAWTATGRDISIDRSLNNSGFVAGDVMQVALETGGVVGWWGRVTI